jgi:acylphosphatase
VSRARFIVRGVVQGVNFRASVVREATRLQITGRVWNRADGGVELVAEGEDAALASLQTWLNEGPRAARVEAVERTDLAGKPRYEGFNITWTAAPES